MKTQPPVGSKVRYTGKFLRSVGLVTGSAGLDRYTVIECACSLCASTMVAVDAPSAYDESRPLHIAFFNLETCR